MRVDFLSSAPEDILRTRNLALVLAATLSVAACGGETDVDSPEVASPAASSEETAEGDAAAEPEATEEETAEVTTTEDAATEDAATEDAATEDTADEEESTPAGEDAEEQDTVDSEKSDRGNIVKQIGEVAAVAPDGEAGEPLVEFVVTDIETDAECSSEYAQEPANGNYIVISMEVTTSPKLADEEFLTSWGISEHEFQVFGEDGKRENDSVGNAFMCLSDNERLPYDIGPGQTVEGKLALDSAHDTGVVAYVPALLQAGWEWELAGTE